MKNAIFVILSIFLLSIATVSADALDGYVKCANEGDTVNFNQLVNVKYGANGFYAEKDNVTGNVSFTNAVFGDPVVGIFKAGYYMNVTKPKAKTNKTEPIVSEPTKPIIKHVTSSLTRERREAEQGKENYGLVGSNGLLTAKNPKSILREIYIGNYTKQNKFILASINGLSLFTPKMVNASHFQIIKYGANGFTL